MKKYNSKPLKALISLLVAALLSTSALGLDAPPWQGQPNTSRQKWTFDTNDLAPLPTVLENSFGDPTLDVISHGDWIGVDGPAQGIWPLSGQMNILIPNSLEPREHKDIWLYLTWRPGQPASQPETEGPPPVPQEPWVAVAPLAQMTREDFPDVPNKPGWIESIFKITIEPNPSFEWIFVGGNIEVDEIDIYTRCVPEPASMVLLGFGGILCALRRKRA